MVSLYVCYHLIVDSSFFTLIFAIVEDFIKLYLFSVICGIQVAEKAGF